VRHSREPNELFEVLGDELRAIVRYDARPCFRVLLLCSRRIISMSASVIDPRISQFTMYRMKPSRTLHR
jgi:hypothetical protein